jgi:CubicO group peptidase (beta-lactamase class C family)
MMVTAALITALQCCGGYPSANAADDQGAAEIPWPTKSWPVSTPEEQGMDSASLARLVENVGTYKHDSLTIIRHGRIVTEAYYAPYVAGIRHDLRSVTKSVVGTLIGIEIQRGELDSVDHGILDFFSDKTISNDDDSKRAMTVQHLLDMASGIKWLEKAYTPDESIMQMYRSPDRTAFVLNQPMSNTPGSQFYYNSGNPYVLSALINRKSGQSAFDFAKKELFGPLGTPAPHGAALTPKASRMAKPGSIWRRMTWRGSAISTFTTEAGMEDRSSRRHGSKGRRPARLTRPLDFTTGTCGGRCPRRAPTWPAAVIHN